MERYSLQVLAYFIGLLVNDLGYAHERNSVAIVCKDLSIEGLFLENSTFKIVYVADKFPTLSFYDCPLPLLSYVNFIVNELSRNVSSFQILAIYDAPLDKMPLKAVLLEGLDIATLYIHFTDNQNILSGPMPGFLESLPHLYTFAAERILLPPMPKLSGLKYVDLSHGISSGNFGGCQDLILLIMEGWEISVDNWLTSCPNLNKLKITKTPDSTVFRIVRSAAHLKYLILRECNIIVLPVDFSDYNLQDLRILDLGKNSLKDILMIPSMPFLIKLDLSSNIIDEDGHTSIASLLNRLPMLRDLNLSSNTNLDLCKSEQPSLRINHLRLAKLYLSRTKTTSLCMDVEALPSLKILSLAGNFRLNPVLKFQDLLVSNQSLRVDINDPGFSVQNIQFTEDVYNELKTPTKINGTPVFHNITLHGPMKLDCDCNHAFFAKAIKEKLVIAQRAYCGFDKNIEIAHISNVLPRTLECDKFKCEDISLSSGCVCRRFWEDRTVAADCQGNDVHSIPNEQNLSRLEAPNNQIQTFRVQDLPDTLSFLDVSNNRISYMDEAQSAALFSNHRNLRLSGNPIVCNCGNQAFIHEIQEHYKQIEDYDNVTCAGGDVLVRDVVGTELCLKNGREVLIPSLIVSALVALAGILGTLYYRFRKIIHIYLYARGCLCCVKEYDIDVDRIYDAFLSFCHADETFLEQLLPELEERGFSVCIHYRDWIPGDLIPTQILRSIEMSRRTIIVLSRNFLNSMWGMLEFRTAHKRALKEGIPRVILIIIDDVIDDDKLDGYLRYYTRTNTYIKWGDPWFWDKITYAMPRCQVTRVAAAPLEAVSDRPASLRGRASIVAASA